MDDKLTVELENPQQVNNYLVFRLASVGANLQRKDGTTQKTTWATLETPESQPILVAYALHTGAGPQPENTVTLDVLSDVAYNIMLKLEAALTKEAKNDGW